MFTLSVKVRKEDEKPKVLRKQGVLPMVLYGDKIKNLSLQADRKEFEKIYKQAGESSLISLEIEGQASGEPAEPKDKFLALIHDIQKDPITGDFIHIDFYQPSLTEETEAKIPLVFIGSALAEKELGGTLVKNITEIEVKALPKNLPHQIEVDIEPLKTFDDNILIKDLKVPEGVKILKEPDEIVTSVSEPEKVEEELEKPVEEKVEEVEKVEKPEKEGKEKEEREEKEKKETRSEK